MNITEQERQDIFETQIANLVSAKAAAEGLSAEAIAKLTIKLYKAVRATPVEPEIVEQQRPAVPIEESVQADYIISLESGRKLKMLKRYLKQTHNMTPEQYRAKWGLPDDYPMTAPNYSQSKAKAAYKRGLGKYDRRSIPELETA